MALSTAHTSAKAADVEKLLLLNKYLVTHILPCRVMAVPPNHNFDPKLNLSRFVLFIYFIYLLHGLYRMLSRSQSEESQVLTAIFHVNLG